MCGIVAILPEHRELTDDDVALGRRMLARLEHRGPDDSGEQVVGGAWLGHRRLSIVDLQTGHQPLCTRDGQWAMVGNGEVYNHAEIGADLPEDELRTRSDNEVALHLVRRDGVDALARLRGMFALVVASDEGTVAVARDPLGIKPLYWAVRDDGTRVLASEMSAFEAADLPLVEPFPPGHGWTPDGGLVELLTPVPVADPDVLAGWDGEDEPPRVVLKEVRERLVTAVERRMLGDVPVGVFLSGGLDSSLIAAIAARWCADHGRTLQTFAVGTEGSADLAAARVVAEHLGTEHHEAVVTPDDLLDALPEAVRVIESFDPALVRSAVPNLLLARVAAEHVKVVLTGEGADELFAGYTYYADFETPEQLHDELVRTIRGLHGLNLQRCDRTTMAVSLEARVPFLDLDVIALALALPPAAKNTRDGRAEKHLLRAAFAGELPEEILWRGKEQFGDGSGARVALGEVAAGWVTDDDLVRERDVVSPPLRTREELAYWRLFAEALPGVRAERVLERTSTT